MTQNGLSQVRNWWKGEKARGACAAAHVILIVAVVLVTRKSPSGKDGEAQEILRYSLGKTLSLKSLVNRGFPNLVDDIGGIATKVVSEAVAQATDIADKAQGIIDGELPIPRLAVSAGVKQLCFDIASATLCADFNAVENLMLSCFALLIVSSSCFVAPSFVSLVFAMRERVAKATVLTTTKNACRVNAPQILVSFAARPKAFLGPTIRTIAQGFKRSLVFTRRFVSGRTIINASCGTSCFLSTVACLISISVLGFIMSLQRLFQSAQVRLQGDLREGPMASYARALVTLAIVHALITFCTCFVATQKASNGRDGQVSADADELEGRL